MTFELGAGGPEDLDRVLALMDEAVRWLNGRGIAGQWGTEPFSAIPARVDAARGWVGSGGAVLGVRGDLLAGALVLGSAPAYVPPTDRPEVYVVLLVASRAPEARGIGAVLLDHAVAVARARGADRVRVDCYAGGDQELVRFYERHGFVRTDTFVVGEWPGQILEIDLSPRRG